METYSFTQMNSQGIMISMSFTLPESPHASTFSDMCRKFALACGYTEKTVDCYFGEYCDEAWQEFPLKENLTNE